MGKKSSQAWWNTCVISGPWRPSRRKLHPKKQNTQKTTKGGKKSVLFWSGVNLSVSIILMVCCTIKDLIGIKFNVLTIWKNKSYSECTSWF